MLSLLQSRRVAITHKEIHEIWPSDLDRPSATTLYEWLNHAFARKLLRREGQGTSKSPWRYRLENEDDKYWDRGELPPIRMR